jgi:hypothetical protein
MMVGKPIIYTRPSSYQTGFNQCWEDAYTATWTSNFIKGYKSYTPPAAMGAVPVLGLAGNSNNSEATTTYVTTTYDDEVEPDSGEADEDGNPVYPDTGSVIPTDDDDEEEALQRAQIQA